MSTEIKMLPATATFIAYKGDTLRKTIELKDAQDNPVSIAGCSVKMQVRKKSGDPVLFEMSTVPGQGITVSGNLISISKNVALAKGNYKFDMEIQFPSGVVRTYLSGPFIVVDEITTS